MRTTASRQHLQLSVVLFGLLAACGSNAGLPSINPSISISSPTNNSSVNLPSNKQIALGFNTNYTVRAPGTCQGTENCGHVYVLVDNSSCNLSNLPYNNLASSSPSFADLSRCVTATGMHTVTVELRHDDGTIVSNLVGTAVTDKVTITAQ
jgi:hypothetical protein